MRYLSNKLDPDWREFLDTASEDEIFERAKREFEYSPETPFVLASAYSEVAQYQETPLWNLSGGRHPRRPVIMRGAKGLMICNHSLGVARTGSANGYALDVFERFLRAKKPFLLTAEERSKLIDPIILKLRGKYQLSSRFFNDANARYAYLDANETMLTHNYVVVDGEKHLVNCIQIREMERIGRRIKKLEKLERAMARL